MEEKNRKEQKENRKADLYKKLTEGLNYTEKQAEIAIEDLQDLDSELRPVLESWLSEGVITEDKSFQGYTVKRLMELYQMEFVGALLTLDWIIKEPEKAAAGLPDPKPY